LIRIPVRRTPAGAVFRLRPHPAADARGYVRFRLTREGDAPAERVAPAAAGLNLLVSARDGAGAVVVDSDEASIEPLGFVGTVIARLRRRYLLPGGSVLDFAGVEVYPEGPKSKTRNYRQQLNAVRSNRTALDSHFVSTYPELLMGWRAQLSIEIVSTLYTTPPVAITLHLHYLELWDEIEFLLSRLQFPFTLILTLTSENSELAARAQAFFPGAVIRVVENRGRDVRPFLMLLEEGVFDPFEVVCKIHGKRSLGAGQPLLQGDLWRRAIFLDLLAAPRQARDIVQRFADDANLGIVGPRRFLAASRPNRPQDLFTGNRAILEDLAARMAAPIRSDDFDFFLGTMFWARPRALKALRSLGLAANGFAPEAGLQEGTMEHAVERIFNFAVRHAGFRVASASAPLRERALKPIPVGRRLNLTDIRFLHVLKDGWSDVEDDGIWSLDTSSRIAFALETPVSEIAVRIRLKALAARDHLRTFNVVANGRQVGAWTFADHRRVTKTVRIALPSPKRRFVIRLTNADPVSPFDLGVNDDRRKLGLYVSSLRVDVGAGAG